MAHLLIRLKLKENHFYFSGRAGGVASREKIDQIRKRYSSSK